MECTVCRAVVLADANFCSQCGTARSAAALGQTIKLAPAKVATLRFGSCPLCLSNAVYLQSGGLYDRVGLQLAATSNPAAPLNTYVCIQCGYVELFLTEHAPIAMIQSQWQHVESDF